jgi:hypothetical protein
MNFIQICSAVHIMKYGPIARQRLGKQIPARAYLRNRLASVAGQRVSKQAFSLIEAVFSAWSVQSGYIEVFGSIEQYRIVVE